MPINRHSSSLADARSLQYAIHCARMEDEKDRKGIFNKDRKHAMRLYLINPSNPLVSIVKIKESRWNRYRVWKPLGLMVLAGLTPPEWEISIVDC